MWVRHLYSKINLFKFYLGQAHSAVRDAAGNVRGAYAYINPDGNESKCSAKQIGINVR